MPVKSYKVGPGELVLGTGATVKDFTAQVTSLRVEWSENVEDDVPTLDGSSLEGVASYAAVLAGTVVQDISDGGIVPWSWENKGQRVPFTYTPNDQDEDASFAGVVRVAPLNAGGDVRTKPTADLSWACIGEPTISHGLAG